MNNFIKRTISSVVFAALMLFALLSNYVLAQFGLSEATIQLTSKLIFGAFFLFALIVMMKEFLSMTCGNNYKYSQILSIVSGACLFVLVFMYKALDMPGRLVVLTFIPIFILMINSLYEKDRARFDKFANLYTAILYIAVPWSLLNFAIIHPWNGFDGRLLLAFFCIIWGSDVGAYLFGITLGQKFGKKLFPSISPKKSWIGFWGGMLVAIAVTLVLYYFTDLIILKERQYNLIHCIAIAILIDVSGVYGDLIESQWKRHYDVKDSGTIIPGHGGLLDRFDSALIAIPVGIIYLVAWNVLFV